jgi:hypothetical protein
MKWTSSATGVVWSWFGNSGLCLQLGRRTRSPLLSVKELMCGRIGFDAALGDKRTILTGDMAVVQEFKMVLYVL